MSADIETACDFSREALMAQLGPELYAIAVEAAANAPAPSPQKVEAVRRILAPAVARLAATDRDHAKRVEVSRAA